MTEQKRKWVMPDWMEPYRTLISNGDERKKSTTSVEAFMNDTGTNPFNNSIKWGLMVSVDAKVKLLEVLHENGVLPKNLGSLRLG